MHRDRYSSNHFQPHPASNGLGIAGFVVSLASVLACGLTSPIGLLLSLFALRRKPRGFALAGTAIGGIGTALVAAFILLTVRAGTELQNNFEYQVKSTQTRSLAEEATVRIEEFRAEHDALPDDLAGNKLVVEINDAWDKALRYDTTDGGYVIRSAGPDGQFETSDDVTLPRANFAAEAPGETPVKIEIE